MKKSFQSLVVCGFAATMALIMGCPQVPGTFTVDIPIDDALGLFVIPAGEPQQSRGQVTITGVKITSASFSIDPANVVVTVGGGPAKGTTNLQDTTTITVSAKFAGFEAIDTVCDTGESVGPFTITLDADHVPSNVDPPDASLSPAVVGMINNGGVSVCLEASADEGLTADIQALTFQGKLAP